MISIQPYQYIEVLDNNTSVKRTECGPKIFVKQDHETITSGKDCLKFISITPLTYCEV